MGYEVHVGNAPKSRRERTGRRTFVAQWDGSGPKGEQFARAAVLEHLSFFVQDVATEVIRDLREPPGSPETPDTPGATEVFLTRYLNGLSPDSLDALEVTDSQEEAYTVTAIYGLTQNALQQQFDTSGQLSNAANGADEPSVVKSYEFFGGPQGGRIDYAPLLYLFAREEAFFDNAANGNPGPVFDPGSLNAIRTGDDGAGVKVRGLEYRAPEPTMRVSFEMSGSSPLSSYLERLRRAADVGVLNDQAFAIDGVQFDVAELLFCEFRSRRSSNGKTQIDLGFAGGDTISVPVAFDNDTGAYRSANFNLVHGSPAFYLYDPSDLAGGITSLEFSTHDYNWAFHDTDYTNAQLVRTQWVSVHRVWQEANFPALFFNGAVNPAPLPALQNL